MAERSCLDCQWAVFPRTWGGQDGYCKYLQYYPVELPKVAKFHDTSMSLLREQPFTNCPTWKPRDAE